MHKKKLLVKIFTVDILSKQWKLEDSADVQDKIVNFIEQIFSHLAWKADFASSGVGKHAAVLQAKLRF